MAAVKDRGDEELYNKLDSAYLTEEEDSEVCSTCLNDSIFHLRR